MIAVPIIGRSTTGIARTDRTATDEIATHGMASTVTPTASTAVIHRHKLIFMQNSDIRSLGCATRARVRGKSRPTRWTAESEKTALRTSRSELLHPTYHFCCLYVCVSTLALFLFYRRMALRASIGPGQERGAQPWPPQTRPPNAQRWADTEGSELTWRI
jgi:hypothetical protein